MEWPEEQWQNSPQERTCSHSEPSSGMDTICHTIESLNPMSNVCGLVVSNSCDPIGCSPPGSSVMEFPRQEYSSGLPCPSPGNLHCRQTLLPDNQGSPLNHYCEVFQHIPESSIMKHSLSSQVLLHSTVYQNFLCSGSPDSFIPFTPTLFQTGSTLHENYLGWPKSFCNIFPKSLNEAFGQPSTWHDHQFCVLRSKFPCHLTLGNLWLGCSRKSAYASMKLHPLHFPSTSLAVSLPLLLAPCLLSHLQLFQVSQDSVLYPHPTKLTHPFPWLSTVYAKRIFWNLLSLNDLFSYHMRVGLCEMNNGRIDGMLLPRQGHCVISAYCCFLDCMLQGELAAMFSSSL